MTRKNSCQHKKIKYMKRIIFKLLLALFVLTGCNREDEPTIPVLDKSKGFGTPVTEKSENHAATTT